MGIILAEYMKLVPTVDTQGCLVLPNGSELEFDDTQFHSILYGGDQLTVARMRGTQALRWTHSRPVDRFDGLIPVLEDWHARMTLMKVYILNTRCIAKHDCAYYYFRQFGVGFTKSHLVLSVAQCTTSVI